MIPWFVLGLCLLAAAVLLGRWFLYVDPKRLAKIVKWGGLGTVAVVALFLAVTGRFGLLMPAAFAAYLFFRRARRIGGGGRLRSPSSGQSSQVNTEFLEMTLDHDSGVMRGRVCQGRFEGRELDDLSFDDLLALLDETHRADRQSAALLESYLDRMQGADWRERAEASPRGYTRASADGPMTREEAYRILGLDATASEDEIKEAHHRLMLKIHPDQGGSTYLAAKINQAKEVLVGG